MKSLRDKKQFDNYRAKVSTALVAALFAGSTMLCAQASADDTEIFFAESLGAEDTTANVLFMFDTSGSMADYDSGTDTRLSRLKQAMTSVVNTSNNVNIAIGSFAGSNAGSIQLPSTNVDADMCPDGTCTSLKIRAPIKRSSDDAELNTQGGIELTGAGLDVSAWSRVIGLRFDNLNIPRGATINDARLEWIPRGQYSGSTNYTIRGEATDNSATFLPVPGNIMSRAAAGKATNAEVVWYTGYWYGSDYGRNSYQSPRLNSIVSEITGRDGWCGGNALTLIIEGTGEDRAVRSYDDDPFLAPVLQIDYSPASVDWNDTCVDTKTESNIAVGIDDVVQDVGTGAVVATADQLRTHTGTSAQAIGLRFTNIDIPANADITSAYLSLPLKDSIPGDVNLTVKVEDSVYSAVIDSAATNALTGRVFMSDEVLWEGVPDDGSVLHSADISNLVSAVVSKAGWARNGAMTFSLTPAAGSTGQRFFDSTESPVGVSPTLVVHYQQDGTDLGGTAPVLQTGRDVMVRTMMDYVSNGGTPLVDAYYESSQYMRGGAVVHGGASASGTYTGPEFGECKSNQIVLLSDGIANMNKSQQFISNLIESAPTAGTSTTPACADGANWAENCGIELATWLKETDHDDVTSGMQSITTNTIGFNTSSAYLESIAEAGGGTYYQADSATELASVFRNIINSAITADTSFIAPTSSANLANRLVNSNELYFAMFKPSTTAHWDGNLKRFQLGTNSTTGKLEVRDAMSAEALNPDGTIKDTAQSFWSAGADGGFVSRGGAASRLSLTRNLYTTINDAATSTTVLGTFHESNTAIDLELLGIPAQNDGYRTELLQWARGVDVKDYDGDSDVTEVRAQMGDIMHSTPYILNYPPADESTSAARSLIFAGTNHGFLHAIDTADGTEEFGFIPHELLPNLNYFFLNDTTKHDRRPYGLDGAVSGWHDDTNDNGIVDNNEKAYIYVGMRRGGRNYYALDVSNPADPQLAWQIQGGQGEFAELGQSWSRPVKAKVKYNSADRDVLFFTAGYDDINDDESQRAADTVGRGIFMVDAATGELISSRDDTDFSEMVYSFPSDLRVISPDGDAYADAIFVGDTGGQLWRFDINHNATNDSAFMSGYVMANVSGTLAFDNRQFFYEPDVALVKDEEGRMFLNIGIGSGSRPGPNSRTVNDSFYSLRDASIFGPPRDADGAIDYPSTLSESNLVNTSLALGSEDDSGKIANGWFLRFPSTGEKSLSTALTVDNQLMFTTYVPPETGGDICTATIGSGRIYTLDVFNGNPGGGSEVIADRSAELDQPGIPARVSGLIVEAAPNTVSVFVGLESIGSGAYNKPFERTFWAEQ